ncbi:hypothetical protein JAAARDRAFT_198895 [Jaapia argillacea MUCL 33604]|uniref:Uncharacterized protein n=1 Tax=Jaapia argillacea MUCL 33604 TaxID=933084 RepID=A0A067PKR0_9AGAM|nr:hypothetical protein JAAARDRAFT_198895 [Jaapia argillacea MUCL 33604]
MAKRKAASTSPTPSPSPSSASETSFSDEEAMPSAIKMDVTSTLAARMGKIPGRKIKKTATSLTSLLEKANAESNLGLKKHSTSSLPPKPVKHAKKHQATHLHPSVDQDLLPSSKTTAVLIAVEPCGVKPRSTKHDKVAGTHPMVPIITSVPSPIRQQELEELGLACYDEEKGFQFSSSTTHEQVMKVLIDCVPALPSIPTTANPDYLEGRNRESRASLPAIMLCGHIKQQIVLVPGSPFFDGKAIMRNMQGPARTAFTHNQVFFVTRESFAQEVVNSWRSTNSLGSASSHKGKGKQRAPSSPPRQPSSSKKDILSSDDSEDEESEVMESDGGREDVISGPKTRSKTRQIQAQSWRASPIDLTGISSTDERSPTPPALPPFPPASSSSSSNPQTLRPTYSFTLDPMLPNPWRSEFDLQDLE